MDKKTKWRLYVIIALIAIGTLLMVNLEYWGMIRYVQGDFANNGEMILRYEYGYDHVIDNKEVELNRVYTNRKLFLKGARYLYFRGAIIAPSINQVYTCLYSNFPYTIEQDNTILFRLVKDSDLSAYDGWVDKTSGMPGKILRVWFRDIDMEEDEAFTIEVYRVIRGNQKLIRQIPLPAVATAP